MLGKLFIRYLLGVLSGVGSIYLFTILIVKKLEDMD